MIGNTADVMDMRNDRTVVWLTSTCTAYLQIARFLHCDVCVIICGHGVEVVCEGHCNGWRKYARWKMWTRMMAEIRYNV